MQPYQQYCYFNRRCIEQLQSLTIVKYAKGSLWYLLYLLALQSLQSKVEDLHRVSLFFLVIQTDFKAWFASEVASCFLEMTVSWRFSTFSLSKFYLQFGLSHFVHFVVTSLSYCQYSEWWGVTLSYFVLLLQSMLSLALSIDIIEYHCC